MAIGLDVPQPPEPENPDEYDYETCPFYGELPVRGQIIEGTVVSNEMDRTVVVEREYDVKVPKYDRYMKRRSRISAHVPGVLEPIAVGANVKIAETRPLSKTKSHVVVEVDASTAGAAGDGATRYDDSPDTADEGGDE